MKMYVTLTFILLVSMATAQDCSNYYYLQPNKTVELSLYDKKGEMTGRLVYSISDVKNSGGFTTAMVQSEMFDKKGRTLAKGSSVMKCNGGVMMINMKMNIPTPQTEQFSQTNAITEDFFIEYPVDMSKGDQLREGILNMELDNNGMKQSVSMRIFDRQVEAKEKVSTPAGTWDCYRISYKSKMSVRMMGIGVPISMEGNEWYAPGFGVVKTSSKQGSTEITSIK